VAPLPVRGLDRVDEADEGAALVPRPADADVAAAVGARTGEEGVDVEPPAPPATGVLRKAKISSSLLGLVADRDWAWMRPPPADGAPEVRPPPAPSAGFLTAPPLGEDPSASVPSSTNFANQDVMREDGEMKER
jgi:hypothetical protein